MGVDVDKLWCSNHSFDIQLDYISQWLTVSVKKIPVNKYLLKVNIRSSRKSCEICSKLTVKATEWRQKRCEICSKLTVKVVERCIDVVLVSLLLTLNIFYTFFLCFYC